MAEGDGLVEIEIRAKLDSLTKDLSTAKKMLDDLDKSSGNASQSAKVLEKAFIDLESRFNSTAKQAAEYQKIQQQVNAAVGANPALQQRANQLLQQAALQYGQATVAQKTYAATMSGISNQLTAFAAGAGPVGVFLASLGPVGLAAALGLSAVAKAIEYVKEESARMGERAIDLLRFTQVTELSIAQIGAMKHAAAEFGISGDSLQGSLERLTFSLNAAHRAGGQLYEEIKLINPGLADELQRSNSTVEGINALARAYKETENAAQKAALARAAFGRGGAGQGPLLGAIADAGGIEKMTQNTKSLGEATDSTNARWAKMQTKITELEKSTKNILAGAITEEGLRLQLEYEQGWNKVAKSIAEINRQREGLTWFQSIGSWFGETARMIFSSTEELRRYQNELAKTSAMQILQRGGGTALSKQDIKSWVDLGDALRGLKIPGGEAIDTLSKLQQNAATAAKKSEELVSVMGPGATFAEQLKAKVDKLTSSYYDQKFGVVSSTEAISKYNKAIDATKLENLIQVESTRLGLLGNSASTMEQVVQKQNEINAANTRGAGITGPQAANIRRVTQENILGVAAMKQQIDSTNIQIATMDMSAGAAARYKAIQDEINKAIIAGKPIKDSDRAEWEKYGTEIGKTTNSLEKLKIASEIRFASGTAFLSDTDVQIATKLKTLYGGDIPAALASSEAAALRLTEGFKTFSSASLSQVTSSLADIATGAKTAAQGFTDLKTSIIRALTEMIIKMTVTIPIARALQSVLGGFLPSGGSTVKPTGTGFEPGGYAGGYASGGIVGKTSVPQMLVHPGVFSGAPHFTSGGMVGGGVPIIAHRGEGVFTPAQMAAMGGGGTQVHIHNYLGGEVSQKQSTGADGRPRLDIELRRMVQDMGEEMLSNRGSRWNRAMTRTIGSNPAKTVG